MKKSIKEKFERNRQNMEMYEQHSYDRKQKSRTKRTPVTFTYTSEYQGEDAFFDVLSLMRHTCKSINMFFTRIDNGEECGNVEYYFKEVANSVARRPPMLLSKQNIRTSFSISSNRLYLKMESGVAFEFILSYQIEDGKAYITGCTGNVTIYSGHDDLAKNFIEDGWETVTRKGNARRNNRTSENVSFENTEDADQAVEEGNSNGNELSSEDSYVEEVPDQNPDFDSIVAE